MAPAAPPEPARPRRRSRGVDPPPQLRRDRPRIAEPRDGAAPGRAPGGALARTQPPADRRRLRADVRPAHARRPRAAAGARGDRAGAEGPRAVPGARGRPALEPDLAQPR